MISRAWVLENEHLMYLIYDIDRSIDNDRLDASDAWTPMNNDGEMRAYTYTISGIALGPSLRFVFCTYWFDMNISSSLPIAIGCRRQ